MKAVIIEDERQAVIALQQELKTISPEVKVLGNAPTIQQAYELIINTKPDLVFLDIQLKDGNGFELLAKFDTYNFKIIFTTAYSEYALKAIKISALDYLLKPIDGEELSLAVSKANKKDDEDALIHNLVQNSKINPLHNKIALQTAKGISLYEVESIIRLQAESNYTAIYFTNNKKTIASKTLKDFEDILATFGFVRIHHSHIINLSHLQTYNNKDGGYVVMRNNTTLPVSKRKKGDLLTLLTR